MSQSQYSVNKLYQSVIDDVIQGTREAFLDEGIDEQVQQELRMLWESKLVATRAVDSDTQQGTSGANANNANGEAQLSQPQQSSTPTVLQNVIGSSDQLAQIPIQITMPRGPSDPAGFQRMININVPAACIHSNKLQDILSLPKIQSCLALPADRAAATLQASVDQALISAGIIPKPTGSGRGASTFANSIPQIDGGADSSSEDDDEDDDDNDEDEVDDKEDEEEEQQEEEEAQDEEPLNSGDDVSDNDDTNENLYAIDNVVVCQFDKITRTRNKWKFHLKDGIMNLNGKDYVFQKANGDAEW